MERIAAQSSNIASYGYDAAHQVLEVEFNGGRVYHYPGVPPEVYDEFAASPSVGSYMARSIRPFYAHAEGEWVPPTDEDEQTEGEGEEAPT